MYKFEVWGCTTNGELTHQRLPRLSWIATDIELRRIRLMRFEPMSVAGYELDRWPPDELHYAFRRIAKLVAEDAYD